MKITIEITPEEFIKLGFNYKDLKSLFTKEQGSYLLCENNIPKDHVLSVVNLHIAFHIVKLLTTSLKKLKYHLFINKY